MQPDLAVMSEREIFEKAAEFTDPRDREDFLRGVCGANAAMLERVKSLLQSDQDAGSFLERPVLEQSQPSSEAGSSEATTSQIRDKSCQATEETSTEPAGKGIELSFLDPPQKSGALGRLAHYEILEIIGQGGMGVVLKASDEKLQRIVAIKVMASPLATHATARKRFLREAHAAAAVSHDHVITIHAVDEFKNVPFLVMNCVSGSSLQEKIDKSGPLELKEILRIGMQTAQGLAAAHAQGLVHRDVKPANILLENGVQRVKLTDFGLARAVDDASMTQSGVITGTPQYMSPEQAEGKAVDHRSDLFSLGSVLYAMCTGHAPFRASTTMAVLKRVCEEAPRPIKETNPEIPGWLCKTIDRLHNKNPDERFLSAKELAEELESGLSQVQQPGYVAKKDTYVSRSTYRTSEFERRYWKIVGQASLIVIAIVALLSGSIYWYESRISPSPWIEWGAGATVALISAVIALRPSSSRSLRWRYLLWGGLLSGFLVIVGFELWGVYTGRYFNKLIMELRIPEANQMMNPSLPESIFVQDRMLSLRLPSGKILGVPLDAKWTLIAGKNSAGLAEHEFCLQMQDSRELTAWFSAQRGRVRWLRTDLEFKKQNRTMTIEEWNDFDRLQGNWIGQKVDPKLTKTDSQQQNIKATFTGDQLQIVMPSLQTFEGMWRLETARSPKRILVTRSDGTNRTALMHGIYEIKGDLLRICMGEPEEEPREFATKPGTRIILVELYRENKGQSLDDLVRLAERNRDLAREEYNAGKIAIHDYLIAQIKLSQTKLIRAQTIIDRNGQEQALAELISLWRKQHDIAKQRHQAGLIQEQEVNAVEQELLKTQNQLRQLREPSDR